MPLLPSAFFLINAAFEYFRMRRLFHFSLPKCNFHWRVAFKRGNTIAPPSNSISLHSKQKIDDVAGGSLSEQPYVAGICGLRMTSSKT